MRLTALYYGLDYGFTKPCDDLEHLQLVADKLGPLEDREEEFGVDLVKLLSARKVYYIAWRGKGDGLEIRETYRLLINLTERTIEYYRDECSDFTLDLNFRDYGKKDVYGGWAFTKEELL